MGIYPDEVTTFAAVVLYGVPVAVAVLSYLLGCINGAIATSHLFYHDDVRRHGSGNAGLTNFYRNYGARCAPMVIAFDMLKAVGAVLLGINPIYTFLVCVPTRILAGWLCGVAFKGLNKLDKTNLWSFGAAGLIGALCNTVLFMTTLCLCFYNTEYIQGFVAALGSANAFLFVIAFVGVNGLVEGAVCLITGAAIAKAVMYSRGKLAARKTNA